MNTTATSDALLNGTTDYLVVGAGAMGMAFTDVVLAESDATVTIVDRRGRPGGHWNDAYPFVRLHQPSAFYGVDSTELGTDRLDELGWNAGLYELASGTEVVSYFDRVMQQRFLPSGRVRYLPMCEYRDVGPGQGIARSSVSGADHRIDAGTIVDATYMNVSIPSIAGPAYAVDPGVRCVPLNDLPRVTEPPDGYTVVGGGKTAMDACLWLLANGVAPEQIRWIRPRDSWLLDRARIQPFSLIGDTLSAFANQAEQLADAGSIDDMFERLESVGSVLRIDPDVRPTMYRCATVTRAELDQLRRIDDVVRLGRVERIGTTEIVLDGGSIPTTTGTLHVDCSADGLTRLPERPIFDGNRLTLQPVRTCQQVFSAAFIAHVECAYDDQTEKNDLCGVVAHPDSDIDYLRTYVRSTRNGIRWREDADLERWLNESRLNAFGAARATAEPTPALLKALRRITENTPAALANVQHLLADVD